MRVPVQKQVQIKLLDRIRQVRERAIRKGMQQDQERNADEVLPDVTASINVTDEIVHGTASVKQSHNSHPAAASSYHHEAAAVDSGIGGGGGVIKVRHYIEGAEGTLPERAMSQAARDHALRIEQASHDGSDQHIHASHDENHPVIAFSNQGDPINPGNNQPDLITETTALPRAQFTLPNTAVASDSPDYNRDNALRGGADGQADSGTVGGAAQTEVGRNEQFIGIVPMRHSHEFSRQIETPRTGVVNTGSSRGLPMDGSRQHVPLSSSYQHTHNSSMPQRQSNEQSAAGSLNAVNAEGEPLILHQSEDRQESGYLEQTDSAKEVAIGDRQEEEGDLAQKQEAIDQDSEREDDGGYTDCEGEEPGQEEDQDQPAEANEGEGQNFEPQVSLHPTSRSSKRTREEIDQIRATHSKTSVQQELERLVINLNHTAMASLKNDQYTGAMGLLTKAEKTLLIVDEQCTEIQMASDSIGDLAAEDAELVKQAIGTKQLDALKNRLMGLTYNNMGCLMKQKQDFSAALVYLKKALYFESRLEDFDEERFEKSAELREGEDLDAADLEFQQDMRTIKCNSAGTVLNICAILSKLGKHKQANEYAQEAASKLRNSMKLTKQQVLQAERKISQADDRLEQAREQPANGCDTEDGSSVDQDATVNQLRQELHTLESQKVDLQNQWVNLATTAVIAHYNSAVEFEFMSQWSQALTQYERALKLASLAMKQNNPMSDKIKQAITKMRIKVRNKVQLPDKLLLQESKNAGKVGHRSSVNRGALNAGISRQSGPQQKDWQNSLYSTKSSQQPVPMRGLHQQKPTMSNEFTMRDLRPSPTNFHPTGSLENQDPGHVTFDTRIQTTSQFETSHQTTATRESFEGSIRRAGKKATSVGLKTAVKPSTIKRYEKSPISLRKIINKLEQTEKQEARLKPKGRLNRSKQARNNVPASLTIHNQFSSLDQSERPTTKQLGPLRGAPTPTVLNQIRTIGPNQGVLAFKHSRNGFLRTAINSAGAPQEGDPSFLPQLAEAARGNTAGYTTMRLQQQTADGMRQPDSPLTHLKDRNAATGMPARRADMHQPASPINAWAGSTVPSSTAWGEPRHQSPRDTGTRLMAKPSLHKRNATFNDEVSRFAHTLETPLSPSISPTTLQMHLSVAQERRLVEQGKRLGANLTKREQDINFFLGHIKKNSSKSSRKNQTQRLVAPAGSLQNGPISTDLASVRAQVLLESSQAQSSIAGSAYLPSKFKKTLKQRSYVSQIKSMQRQMVREQQVDLNSQLETAFQREMAVWKREREETLGSKLRELEEVAYSMARMRTLEAERALETAAIQAQASQQDQPLQELDQQDSLSAEQAQEAVSIRQEESAKKLAQQESEAGNMRVSPPPDHSKSKDISLDAEGAALQIQDQGPDATVVRNKTEQELAAQRNGRQRPSEQSGSHHAISEYVSSQNKDDTAHNDAAVSGHDALSGTCREVELEQRSDPNKQSEVIEVEDIVSADTNNQVPPHNFQSYRTSSNVFNNNRTARNDETVGQPNDLCRINADSALLYSSAKGDTDESQPLDKATRRNQNAKSTLAMSPNDLTKINSPDGSLRGGHQAQPEGHKIKSPKALVPALPIGANSPKTDCGPATTQLQNERRQSNIDASSISESQYTVTEMTQQSRKNLEQAAISSRNPTDTDRTGADRRTNTQRDDPIGVVAEAAGDDTLHEDTLMEWTAQRRGTNAAESRFAETPDYTDDAPTVIDRKSHIGDGPIFIKKSTEWNSVNRRFYTNQALSQKSLGVTTAARTMQRRHLAEVQKLHTLQLSRDHEGKESENLNLEQHPRPSSRAAGSDLTMITDPTRYLNSRIREEAKHIQVDPAHNLGQRPRQKTNKSVKIGRNSIGQRSSNAQRSDLAYNKRMSGQLSLDSGSIGASESQVTVFVPIQREMQALSQINHQVQNTTSAPKQQEGDALLIESGQASIQNIMAVTKNESFLTPRPAQNQAPLIKQEAPAFDRSSIDTEQASHKLPSHIHHSKPSGKPPKVGKTKPSQLEAKRYVAAMAGNKRRSSQASGSQNQRKSSIPKKPSQIEPLTVTPVPIPEMIHINQPNTEYLRTTVTSPTVGKSRPHAPTGATQQQMMAKSGDHSNARGAFRLMQEGVKSGADMGRNQPLQEGMKTELVLDCNLSGYEQEKAAPADPSDTVQQPETPIGVGAAAEGGSKTEDRVAKIAQKISKLNTTLLQFQNEIEESKKDPMLKSTHRSTASKQGLLSQKSRDTNMTVPAHLLQKYPDSALRRPTNNEVSHTVADVESPTKTEQQFVSPRLSDSNAEMTLEMVATPMMASRMHEAQDEGGVDTRNREDRGVDEGTTSPTKTVATDKTRQVEDGNGAIGLRQMDTVGRQSMDSEVTKKAGDFEQQ